MHAVLWLAGLMSSKIVKNATLKVYPLSGLHFVSKAGSPDLSRAA